MYIRTQLVIIIIYIAIWSTLECGFHKLSNYNTGTSACCLMYITVWGESKECSIFCCLSGWDRGANVRWGTTGHTKTSAILSSCFWQANNYKRGRCISQACTRVWPLAVSISYSHRWWIVSILLFDHCTLCHRYIIYIYISTYYYNF